MMQRKRSQLRQMFDLDIQQVDAVQLELLGIKSPKGEDRDSLPMLVLMAISPKTGNA